MKKIFLISSDKGFCFSYDYFLKQLKKRKTFNSVLETNNLFDFYLNLILGLLHDHVELTIYNKKSTGDNVVSMDSEKESLLYNSILFDSIDEVINKVMQTKAFLSLQSSGTTGRAKRIVIPCDRFIHQSRKSDSYTNNIWATAYHSSHMGGLQVFFQAFLNKNVLIFLNGLSPIQISDALCKYCVTHLSATPTFYKLLLTKKEFNKTLKRISLGGEAADVNLIQRLQSAFPNAKVNNIFASSETGTLLVSDSAYFTIPTALVSKMRIINNEIYLHHSLLSKTVGQIAEEEWVATGDQVSQKEDGRFEIVGRNTDLVNVAGNLVNLTIIQQVVDQVAGVRRSRVYARKNALTDYLVCCEIEVGPSFETVADLRQKLFALLPNYAVPRIIKVVDEVSMTISGKILKQSDVV